MSSVKALPIEQRVFLHGELLTHGILPSCGNCGFSQGKPSDVRPVDIYCNKYSAFPPVEVMMQGCIGWEQDIPF